MADAIVIGSGPNGLVAANLLADAGWDVLVLEANERPGGAVRSSELIEPGYINDHCSAFFPLGVSSPAITKLSLEDFGLVWRRSEVVVAHESLDGHSAHIATSLDETARSLGSDGDAWREFLAMWNQHSDVLLSALFTPFPPVRASARLARGLGPKGLIRFARTALLPVRRLGEEHFAGEQARRVIAGLALHADLLPESALSGFYGWLMSALAQTHGFPVPQGGAGMLTRAMVKRLESKGGSVVCSSRAVEVIVRDRRGVAVKCEDGSEFDARRSILADVDAPALYSKLLPADALPDDVLRDLKNFQWDAATFKVDWNLNGPIPWHSDAARRSGTVHVGEGVDALSVDASQLARGVLTDSPFLLLGQQSMTDPTRQPAGKETVWAYTHVPHEIRSDVGGKIKGVWNESETNEFVDRIEREIEKRAPGFRDLVRGRHVMTPAKLQSDNANLVHGSIGGGTAQIHQQLIFRPIPGWGRPETPVRNVYLASSSAHPGGGVHGACGANAARAALFHARLSRRRS